MDIKEQKQQYLRENILQKNYDPEEFMDYCQVNYGGIDIDSWTFEQLKNIVQKFIKQNKTEINFQTEFVHSEPISPQITNQFGQWNNIISQSSPQKNTNSFELNLLDLDFLEGMTSENKKQEKVVKPKQQKKVQKPESKFLNVPSDVVKKLQEGNSNFIVAYNSSAFDKNEIKQKQKQNEKKPVQEKSKQVEKSFSYNESFKQTIQCKKAISKCRLTGKEEVMVSGHEIINPNIFVPKYVLYTLTTNPLNIEVKRRVKDFESLRNLLVKFFPTIQIPHLQRCSRLSDTQPNIIKKQILFLESFVNSIMMNPELKCKLVEEFLMCKDLDLMKKIFKQYEKLKKPQSIQTLFTSTGTVEVSLNSKNEKYLQKQKILNEELQDSFGKLKSKYDELNENFLNTQKTLNDMTEIYEQLKEKIKSLNKQFTPEYQVVQLEKQLKRVQNLHKQWSQSYKTHAKIIESEIRHLFRFERDNVLTLRDLYKVYDEIYETYQKRTDKEQSQKEPYDSKRLSDFKLVLDSPSKHTSVLKYQAGYYQEQCCHEGRRYLTELSSKIGKKFNLFCTLELNIERDMEGVWKDFDNFYI